MKPEDFRIVYAGTPDFAVPALASLIAAGYNVVAVYTQPDRRAGRGRRVQFSPVKTLALEHDIKVEQPQSMRDSCLLYTSPSPRDRTRSRMPSSA